MGWSLFKYVPGFLKRWYWKANGLSHGEIVPAELGGEINAEFGLMITETGAVEVILDYSEATAFSFMISSEGTPVLRYPRDDGSVYWTEFTGIVISTFVLYECTLIARDGVVTLTVNGESDSNAFVAPTYTGILVDLIGGDSSFLTHLKITGITNLDSYPLGYEEWLMDTFAPDDSYIFYGSASNTIMQLYNAVDGDFFQTLPSPPVESNVTIDGDELYINGDAVELEIKE